MNKHLIVTGGTRGIGRSIANLFAEKGYDITTCSRNKKELSVMEEEFKVYRNIEFKGFVRDLSDKNQCKKFINDIESQKREVHVLINNAGSFIPGELHIEEEGNLDLMLDSNLKSAYYVSRGLIPLLKSSRGHLFNMCSIASISPYTAGGSYCISKFALYGMNKILREEMKPFGVRVTAVLPGPTFSSSWEGSGIPEQRLADPADVARSIYNCTELSERSVVEDIIIRPQEGDL